MEKNDACEECPMREAVETGQPSKKVITSPKGTVHEVTAVPLKESDGSIEKVIEIITDITKYKKAEMALVESEHGLKQAQEIAHIGHYKMNTLTREVSGSDEMFKIFDLSKGSEKGLTHIN